MYNINKLINSENEYIKQIGWLLYDRQDQNGGLNNDEVDKLVSVLLDMSEESIDMLLEKEYQEGYEEGYNDGLRDGESRSLD